MLAGETIIARMLPTIAQRIRLHTLHLEGGQQDQPGEEKPGNGETSQQRGFEIAELHSGCQVGKYAEPDRQSDPVEHAGDHQPDGRAADLLADRCDQCSVSRSRCHRLVPAEDLHTLFLSSQRRL